MAYRICKTLMQPGRRKHTRDSNSRVRSRLRTRKGWWGKTQTTWNFRRMSMYIYTAYYSIRFADVRCSCLYSVRVHICSIINHIITWLMTLRCHMFVCVWVRTLSLSAPTESHNTTANIIDSNSRWLSSVKSPNWLKMNMRLQHGVSVLYAFRSECYFGVA